MADRSSWMSREQQVQDDFGTAIMKVRPYLTGFEEAPRALDALAESILRFGVCERRMRRAERLRALGLAEGEAEALAGSALANHERGLRTLPAVRPFAEVLAAQQPDEPTLSRWRESSNDIRAEWRAHVSELDVDQEDARHLAGIMDECCDAVDREGLGGLGGYLSRRLEELDEARRSSDRGTRRASIPYWKIAAAAVILGMTAYAVWVLVASGAPWWNFFLVALVACIMMLIVALAC
ncbi:MAG TPA: hypothetical protein VGF54_19575 [Streptosporangiaceae bacterium]|jgi:hypothetical protein